MISGYLIKRYKRFLADVRLENGTPVTVHCPNPGAMTGLAENDMRVWLTPASAKAKLPYRWQMVETETGLVGIDTGLTNTLVHQALLQKQLPQWANTDDIITEVRLPPHIAAKTRLDFCLIQAGQPYYLEIKSVTLRHNQGCDQKGMALFPDSRTARGEKHLHSLIALRHHGMAAGILYVVQRSDCHSFAIAADIDPSYARAFAAARAAGVEIHVQDCHLSIKDGIRLRQALPYNETKIV